MTLKDDLIAAKALIDTPEKWRKETFAVLDSYCALGAAAEVTDSWGHSNPRFRSVSNALTAALKKMGWADVVNYNDAPSTTHADIMALFDRAIEAAE